METTEAPGPDPFTIRLRDMQAQLDKAEATIARLRAEVAHLGARNQELHDELEARPAGPPPYVRITFAEYRTLLGLEAVIRRFLEAADATGDEGWTPLVVGSWAHEFQAALDGREPAPKAPQGEWEDLHTDPNLSTIAFGGGHDVDVPKKWEGARATRERLGLGQRSVQDQEREIDEVAPAGFQEAGDD